MQKSILRFLLALLLLAGAIYIVGSRELVDALYQIKFIYVVYLIILAILLIWVSAVKWRLFIRAHGHDASIGHLFNLYMVGYFFNAFCPSFIVGDITRTVHLGKSLESQQDAFVSTFLERFTGLVAMAVMGLVFVVIGTTATADVQWAIVVASVPILIGAAMCFSKTLGRPLFALIRAVFSRLSPEKYRAKIISFLGKLEAALEVGSSSKSLLIKSFALSFLFHFLAVINTYVCALAVGWQEPSFGGLCIVVPLVLLVSMVPLTPSGLGLQEGAFLFFLQRVGATHGQALAVGLLLRAKILVLAVIGGLVWMGLKNHKDNQPADSEPAPSYSV